MSIKDKVAIVTGAAQGLGREFCEMLLRNGAKVVLTDLNKDQGTRAVSELRKIYGLHKTMFIQCDVTSQAQMNEMFKTVKEQYGRPEIVINNAGVGFEMGQLWEKTVDVNVKGTIRCTMLAMEYMRRDSGGAGGVIVNIASVAGINPNPCGPVYGATKSAIILFSQAWAKNPELLSNGVRINVLAPAFVETDLLAKLADKTTIHAPEIAEQIIDRVGVLRPETVAEALLDLINDQTKNGAILTISKNTGKRYYTV
ncbi:unnamed protein product [Candidula unifasciata]|uniref:Uncharacterized protein n=1 Tax=Candidula unifasciata TaxID=100452 RepID=A0A8S3ZIP0_9EUPU|nr:unnamed protein product [Candidula unifasciata]